MADRKRKGKVVSSSSQVTSRLKSLYHEAHFNSKLSARRILLELILQVDEHFFNPIRFQIHQRKWEKFTKPIQAVGHLMVKEFYANAWEPDKAKRKPLTYTSMVRGTERQWQEQESREQRIRDKQPLLNNSHKPNINKNFLQIFYTHFDTSMSQIHRRLDQQEEENRKSFEAINTRMDRMDDQLSFLCYSNQMANEQLLFPYQNTTRQFQEMEMRGIPVTMANLAIHRQREEEINQERMRCERILQEAAAQQAKEANKGKSREVVRDSEDEFVSSESEEF
ncbi:hypothetical protein PIB30_079410 [Stylosanthes scabra]|uniref:Uncharacterized protein n=1 Tax=Stylosanthes scabra TaxID=79078 RepID=A0ABU6UQJ0_9FABA|nr:hypothetical protein [Stylosanthes scabra]